MKALGKNPSGKRLERIMKSPNYYRGEFQNVSKTSMLKPGGSYVKILSDALNRPKEVAPNKPLPFVRTDLTKLSGDRPTIVWFGHSSYLIKSRDFTVLVDPVLSGNASPVGFFGKAFPGADEYKPKDFGNIDVLVITHDHYDHMDYKTIVELAPRVTMFVTSLGVGSHLEYWGIAADKIMELDWCERATIAPEVEFISAPARHFSGRTFKRGQTLWGSFILKLHGYNLYLGGDSGYGKHFAQIGKEYGPFDIAFLETGQYGDLWPNIHMTPEETVQAAIDLQAKVLFPVHWAKFVLANHVWNDPAKRVTAEAAKRNLPLLQPKLGEAVILGGEVPKEQWWV